jgi:hypothetical protein
MLLRVAADYQHARWGGTEFGRSEKPQGRQLLIDRAAVLPQDVIGDQLGQDLRKAGQVEIADRRRGKRPGVERQVGGPPALGEDGLLPRRGRPRAQAYPDPGAPFVPQRRR